MPRVYVSIGSNRERERNVAAAVQALRDRYGAVSCSTVYENLAVGFDGAPFYNLVAGFDTGEPRTAVLAALKAIEDRQGRDRAAPRFSDRSVDLDLLLYGDEVDADADLPRAEIVEYAFVLRPLAELAPELRHPVLRRTARELWEALAAHTPADALRPVKLPGLPAAGAAR